MSASQAAIVTGGGKGLGAATCVELLEKGWKVCVADMDEVRGKQLVDEQKQKYGTDNIEFIICDVSKEEDFKEVFNFALKKFKSIDLLVNNAGIVLEQNVKKTIEVNLIGTIIGCQQALQHMGKSNKGKGGMVINVASYAGLFPCYSAPVYAASKHGIIGLTRSYGTEYHLKKDGVLFSALCPSYIATDLLKDCPTTTLDHAYNPIENTECMSPPYVAQGILKIIQDRINGSSLMVSKKGFYYIDAQENPNENLS